jgi:lysophospholipase L1-like esterase
MLRQLFIIIFIVNSAILHAQSQMKSYKTLSLGDSYTIGESVLPEERFINQALTTLRESGYAFTEPRIIAVTGWTTDELQKAIDEAHITASFDLVTLLIGVNNQYRGRSADEYRIEFVKLIEQAVQFASGKPNRVVVLSIPDWGVTPFAQDRDRKKIAEEIDLFNTINKQETLNRGVHYLDITAISRLAKDDVLLTANDKLHPSATMYALWAKPLAELFLNELKN